MVCKHLRELHHVFTVKIMTKHTIEYHPCWKKTIEPCSKHNRKCHGFNGNCIGFNGNYNGVYWYVMDYIGGMLNYIGKIPKHTTKMIFVMVLLEKS